jgi:hypothetical protein
MNRGLLLHGQTKSISKYNCLADIYGRSNERTTVDGCYGTQGSGLAFLLVEGGQLNLKSAHFLGYECFKL